MKNIELTCATCASFNTDPQAGEPTCWNLVFIVTHQVHEGKPVTVNRSPQAQDICMEFEPHDGSVEEAAVPDAHQETTLPLQQPTSHDARIEQNLQEATPEFMTAMSACLRFVETLGIEHPNVAVAMVQAMMIAPPSMADFAADLAKELGLMPDAHGYTAGGEPVFTLDSIASKLDLSVPEAQDAMDAILASQEAMGLPASLIDPATVHRIH
jgi:hypothetical protein